ncbi:MAG: hypothetical protein ACI9SJ_000814 [Flavobacteriaceae bacterium]|jgi:hypothetical protein|uniref:carboxypeptidase-like regulatory domain-containing protein n=1 Tax=Candidatus Marifrigoribacter sp. Uisw_064 TaxID=3230970 RepID=UPI003ADFD78C
MKNFYLTSFFTIFCGLSIGAQKAFVKGRVVDTNSSEVIQNVNVRIQSSTYSTITDAQGMFFISSTDLPQGEQVLLVSKQGYLAQRVPITIQNGTTINLDPLLFEIDLTEIEAQIGIISLSDNELDQDEGTSFNISGLLQASKDVFLNAAAYDFSATFFRPRGLDNANGKVLINGLEMNKLFNGRPQWANWGGINDVQRNREFTMGLKANDYTFGDLAGTTNMVMRASQYRKGGRFSYATANKSYQGRVMGSYHSGLNLNGWAYSVLASRRFGTEGYIDGTSYNANSFFASVEKKINDEHSLNFMGIYTPNRRGKSTAITEEVFRLKGRKYNPNWGYQNVEKRNSRIKEVVEPIIMLNHYWKVSEKSNLNTNLGYQFGKVGNTRLDYGGNRNPAGNYYQRLPSYLLRNESLTSYDYQLAYEAEQEFINDGQLDWNSLYQGNDNTVDGFSTYVLQEDRNDDNQLSFNTIFNTVLNENISLNAAINFRDLKSENFAEVIDLLGGEGYIDFDRFGDGGTEGQSDLLNLNRIVQEGDRYKYNYELNANVVSGFVQGQFKYNTIDFYVAANVAKTKYQRTGIYKNGYFPDEGRSLGDSDELDFTAIGVKAGVTYKLTGRHLIDLNGGYFTKAPTMRNSFANARQSNDLVEGIAEESVKSVDISYIYRSPIVKARLTGYYAGLDDASDIGFFFTQNALGNDDNTAFVQEIVTGISKRNAGVELGIEAQVLPTFKLKAAATIGQNVYTNKPELYLAGDDFDLDPNDGFVEGNDLFRKGKREASLENHHVSGGPERAYQIGIEYRDPNFWWVGVTTNYFSNAYVDVSNLRRTSDFYTDIDGLPYNDYDEEVARGLLKQEQLDDYFLVNVIGGKSWRVKRYYVGFFASINNVLDQKYKTGGFEDSRRASYRQQVEEQGRENGPVFGSRYFFGSGATYYLNIYVRF